MLKYKNNFFTKNVVSKTNIFCDYKLFTQQIIYDGVRNAVLKNNGLAIDY